MKNYWKIFLAVSAYWAGVFDGFYRSLAGVEKPVHLHTGIALRTSSIGLLIGALTCDFVSVPGRWYLVCWLYDQ